MATLAELRAQSKQVFDKVREKTKKGNTYANNNDDRLWNIERNKDGEAFAVIRFLPISKCDYESNLEEAMPWAKVYNHSFKYEPTGRWYIEKSLSTIQKPDPVYQLNRKLYATKNPEDEKQAKNQKRKLNYYSNIYVVKDPSNPENEGKVFLYRYGQKIHDKIKAVQEPSEITGEAPSDPFDFDFGRDFKLQIRSIDDGQGGTYPNYDLSTFTDIKPISTKDGRKLTDKEVEDIWEQSYSLLDFYKPSEFKSFDELQKRLDFVFGLDDGETDHESNTKEEKVKVANRSEKPKEPEKEKKVVKTEVAESSADEEEDLDIDLDELLKDLA